MKAPLFSVTISNLYCVGMQMKSHIIVIVLYALCIVVFTPVNSSLQGRSKGFGFPFAPSLSKEEQGNNKKAEGKIPVLGHIRSIGNYFKQQLQPVPILGVSPTTNSAVDKVKSNAIDYITHRYSRLTWLQKLAGVPLFYVGNKDMHSYMQDDVESGRLNQKVVTYFMDYNDAFVFMHEMGQGSGNINDFRVITTSMEHVLKRIISKKQSRKIGRYPINVLYKIIPSKDYYDTAEKCLTGASISRILNNRISKSEEKISKAYAEVKKQCINFLEKRPDGLLKARPYKRSSQENFGSENFRIPMFHCDGLYITRRSRWWKNEVLDPFYFSLEDLYQDYVDVRNQYLKAHGMTDSYKEREALLPREPKVTVHDFTDVVVLSTGTARSERPEQSKFALTTPQSFVPVAFIPPRTQIEILKNNTRNDNNIVRGQFSKSYFLK